MKLKCTQLLLAAILCFAATAPAQELHHLTNSKDVLLQQYLKEKKPVKFVINQTAKGNEVSYYIDNTNNYTVNAASNSGNLNSAAAGNFHLTKDINAQTNANPINTDFISTLNYAILNNVMYFSANDGVHGAELWRSDGTDAGTYIVKDIFPGSASSSPTEIIVAAGKLYFVAIDQNTLTEALCISDGTAAGTTSIIGLSYNGPGVNGSYYLTNVNGNVYFLNGSSYYCQVWKTDGTINGTVQVKDLSTYGHSPILSATANSFYYFTLYNDNSGRELWRSDGTDAGTFLVKDISDTLDFLDGPFKLTQFNNKLYFTANDGTGRKLWFTDGTTAGTQKANQPNNLILASDFSDGFVNNPLTVQDNNLYTLASLPATGTELYKYNTVNGFSLVKDITPGSKGGYIYNITNAASYIVFVYVDTVNKRNQLWATTGASEGTRLIKSYDNYYAFFSSLTYVNKLLFFTSNTPDYGNELWKTSGTSASTVLVKDIYTGPTSSSPLYLTPYKNQLYFNAASKNAGTELWQSDGTFTSMVKEINSVQTDFSGPNFYNNYVYGMNAGKAINNTLFFSATKPETGYEIYKSDGTNAGTVLSSDIQPGQPGSTPQNFTQKNGAVYFTAFVFDSSNNYGLNVFKVNNVNGNGVQLTKKLNGFINCYAVADNGYVYYLFSPFSGGLQLWKNNGTTGDDVLLNDSIAYTYPLFLKTVKNNVFFTAMKSATGTELWTSDGTTAGTKLVKDIAQGSNSSNPYSLYPYEDKKIIFGADDGSGIALWTSDGTAAGTTKLKSIQPYNQQNGYIDYNEFFTEINGSLYFNASSTNAGAELWKTDATQAGTVLVKNIAGLDTSSFPAYLTNVNGTLFFLANYQQLWKSDGTNAGTVLIKNIAGTSQYAFSERCVAANKFFFNKDQQLWVSDGTDAGTHVVADNGLNGISLVTNLAVAGNTVFFNGYTDKYSYELYAGDANKVVTSLVTAKTSKPEATFTASVLQNPVDALLKLNILSGKNQSLKIIITRENGTVLYNQKNNVQKGTNYLNINAAGWKNGVHTIALIDDANYIVSMHVLK